MRNNRFAGTCIVVFTLSAVVGCMWAMIYGRW